MMIGTALLVKKFAGRDVQDVTSLDEFITKRSKPHAARVLVPGETSEEVASPRGASETIDGDNTDDRGNLKRAKILKSRSIHSVDCDALGKENGVVKDTEPISQSFTPMIIAGALRAA